MTGGWRRVSASGANFRRRLHCVLVRPRSTSFRSRKMRLLLRDLLGGIADGAELHPLVERHPGDLDAIVGEDHPVVALVPVHSS